MRAWFPAVLLAVVVATTPGLAGRSAGTAAGHPLRPLAFAPLLLSQADANPKPPEAKKAFSCGVNTGTVSAASSKVVEQWAKTIAVPAAKEAAAKAAAEFAAEQALKSGAKAVAARAAMAATAEYLVVVEGVAFWTGWGAVVIALGTALYKAFGDDPVDPHFTAIATPRVRPVAPVRVGPGVTAAGARAVDALRANLAQLLAVSEAMLTSNNRAQGAAAAGDATWTRRQTAAFARYALQAAALLEAQPRLRADLRQAWDASRATYRHIRPPATIDFPVAEARQLQGQLTPNGLSADMAQQLRDLGASASLIAEAGRLLASTPIDSPVSFPALLTDPALDTANATVAGALRQWAAAAVAGPQAVRVRARLARGLLAVPAVVASCPAPGPTGAPTPPPSGNAGDLQQDGPITMSHPDVAACCTWDISGAGSLSGKVTDDTTWGKATFTWTLPSRIPRAGAQGTLTLTADAGKAGKSSNLEVELWVRGEVDVVCPSGGTGCTHISAYSQGGKTATATATFTLKASTYSAGRKEPVLVQIGCAWGGPLITIPYRIIQ